MEEKTPATLKANNKLQKFSTTHFNEVFNKAEKKDVFEIPTKENHYVDINICFS